MDKDKKFNIFDVILPGLENLKAPTDFPVQQTNNPIVPEEVIEPKCGLPTQGTEAPSSIKYQAQNTKRYVSISQTEHQEHISLNFERGTTMNSAIPVSNEPPKKVTGLQSTQAWFPILGLFLVGASLFIVSLLILREPLVNWTKAKASERKIEQIAVQDQVAYRQLEADVCGAVLRIEQITKQLELASKGLAEQVESQIGQPLQYIQSHPEERPQKVDLAILQSGDMAESWASLINLTSNSVQMESINLAIQELRNRLNEGRLISADRDRAAGLLALMAQQEEIYRNYKGRIQRITDTLDTQKFEKTLNAMERN